MIIETGSVFLMNESCFTVKDEAPAISAYDRLCVSQSIASWSTASSTLQRRDSYHSENQSQLSQLSSSVSTIPSQMQLNISTTSSQPFSSLTAPSSHRHHKGCKEDTEDIYQIEIVFDKTTKYLAIPMELFKNAMRETSMDTNKIISAQLNQISESIVNRITSMLSWLRGKKELWLQVIRRQVYHIIL